MGLEEGGGKWEREEEREEKREVEGEREGGAGKERERDGAREDECRAHGERGMEETGRTDLQHTRLACIVRSGHRVRFRLHLVLDAPGAAARKGHG